jgi:L-alanine-DL-glutamate epimerase-like enolase superfamily enzyme
MTLSLRLRTLELPMHYPFVIARALPGEGRVVTTVVVELRDDADGPGAGSAGTSGAHFGLGEGCPDAYYGDTPETMAAVAPLLLRALAPIEAGLRGSLDEVRAALLASEGLMAAAIGHHGAIKCAIDIALHDLAGKRLGLPVHELVGVPGDIPPTDFTLGIDAPAVVAERARSAADFPALKIKVGGPSDLETLEAVRAVYGGPIRVDANTAWTPEGALLLLPELQRLGVELIEQPFPARRLDQLCWLQDRSPLPIVADESAVTIEDLDGLVDVVEGVNVKLAKCGGIAPARRMLERARELGFRTFLGCMEETSIGIAASAAVSPLAEWVDLDGCLLLADDPVTGLELGPDKRWRLPDRPGLGLDLRPDART